MSCPVCHHNADHSNTIVFDDTDRVEVIFFCPASTPLGRCGCNHYWRVIPPAAMRRHPSAFRPAEPLA